MFMLSLNASGRTFTKWDYHAMWKKADTVIIGTHLASSDVEKKKVDPSKPAQFIKMKSKFAQKALLKGKHAKKVLELLHYRYLNSDSARKTLGASSFIQFSSQCDYILFLKTSNETGFFEPISGQQDPWQSVRLLTSDYAPCTKKNP